MNEKSITWYIVKRYLRFDKEQPFIFLSAFLAFLGIMLGVAVLMIAMSLMNGFSIEFKKKLTVMNYPLTIIPRFFGQVDESMLFDLKAEFPSMKFSPYLVTTVVAKNGSKVEGGYLFGVDFEDEASVNRVLAKAMKGKQFSKYDVVIGQTLLQNLFLKPDKKLTYIFTQLQPAGIGNAPSMKRFLVAGVYDSGLAAYDSAFSYTSLEALRTILHKSQNLYDGIHVYSAHPEEDIKKIQTFLSDSVRVKGWWEDNANVYAALEMEKRALFIVLMLIILIAAVNIISSLLMTVMNRRSEIALLITLGISAKEIKQIFLKLGVIIGISGIVLGVLLGFSGMWIIETFDLIAIPEGVYPFAKLPLILDKLDFTFIVSGAFFIVLLSSYYPAYKASKIDVLTVLRNE